MYIEVPGNDFFSVQNHFSLFLSFSTILYEGARTVLPKFNVLRPLLLRVFHLYPKSTCSRLPSGQIHLLLDKPTPSPNLKNEHLGKSRPMPLAALQLSV